MPGDGWYVLAILVLCGAFIVAVSLFMWPVAIVLLAIFLWHQLRTYE